MSVTISDAGAMFATDAEAIKGDLSSVVISPESLNVVNLSPSVMKFFTPTWTGGTSGAGAAALSVYGNQRVTGPTSAVGYAIRNHICPVILRGTNPESGPPNFSKRITWGFRVVKMSSVSGSADAVCRIVMGKLSSSLAGDPTSKSLGISFTGGAGVVKLIVHDGTTFTAIDTDFQPQFVVSFDCLIVSDGQGNAELYINGTLKASTSLAPVGAGIYGLEHRCEVENVTVLTAAPLTVYYANQTINIEP